MTQAGAQLADQVEHMMRLHGIQPFTRIQWGSVFRPGREGDALRRNWERWKLRLRAAHSPFQQHADVWGGTVRFLRGTRAWLERMRNDHPRTERCQFNGHGQREVQTPTAEYLAALEARRAACATPHVCPVCGRVLHDGILRCLCEIDPDAREPDPVTDSAPALLAAQRDKDRKRYEADIAFLRKRARERYHHMKQDPEWVAAQRAQRRARRANAT